MLKKKPSLSMLATFQHIKKYKKTSDMKNKIDEKKHMTEIKRRNTQLSNYNWILMLSALPRRNIRLLLLPVKTTVSGVFTHFFLTAEHPLWKEFWHDSLGRNDGKSPD